MTYSNTLAMNRKRFAARQQNTTRFTTQARALGPVSNTIVLLIMACLLGLLYLTQVTKTNALSYQLNDLKTKQGSLQEENNELQVNAARLLSLERAKDSKVTAGLVNVTPSATAQN